MRGRQPSWADDWLLGQKPRCHAQKCRSCHITGNGRAKVAFVPHEIGGKLSSQSAFSQITSSKIKSNPLICTKLLWHERDFCAAAPAFVARAALLRMKTPDSTVPGPGRGGHAAQRAPVRLLHRQHGHFNGAQNAKAHAADHATQRSEATAPHHHEVDIMALHVVGNPLNGRV